VPQPKRQRSQQQRHPPPLGQVPHGVPDFGMGMGMGMTGFGGLGMNMGMSLDDLLVGGDGPVEWDPLMDIGV